MADFGGADLDAFRAEAREWLAANFPKSLAHQPAAMIPGAEAQTKDHKLWKERMAEKGWGTPTWPTKYGGGPHPAAGPRAAAGDGPHRRLQSDDGHGPFHVRPDALGIRHRGPETAPHPAHREGRDPLVPGLLRTRCGLRPRQPADQVRRQGRPLA